jgi:hypothetical protein
MTDEVRIVPCGVCDGDRGWHRATGIVAPDGSVAEEWTACTACGGTGDEEVAVVPVTEAEVMAP